MQAQILGLITPLVAIVIAITFAIIWRVGKMRRHVLGYAISYAAFAIGFLISHLLPASSPYLFHATQLFYSIGTVVLLASICERVGQQLHLKSQIAVYLISLAAMTLAVIVSHEADARLLILNTGLGVMFAMGWVGYFMMRYRGELLRGGVGGFLARCCGPQELGERERIAFVGRLFTEGRLRSVTDEVAPRVFAPGERTEFAVLDRPPETDAEAFALWQAVDRARRDLELEVCYCSVFEDCWTAVFSRDEETGLFTEDRREVEICEMPDG